MRKGKTTRNKENIGREEKPMMNPSIPCVNPLILMQGVSSLVPNVLRPQTMCVSRPNVGSPRFPSVLAFKTLKIAAPVGYTV